MIKKLDLNASLTFRIPKAERKKFYKACKDNGDYNPAERIRHMIRDYTSGKITYKPTQPGE